jgi:hypothetical protein
MTKRLQVLLEDDEIAKVREAARHRQLTTAEWVRQSLRSTLEDERSPDVSDKLEALALASRYSFPTGDIDQMLAEIETGYLEPVPDELA